MSHRPSTLRGRMVAATLGLVCIVLAVAFLGIDLLLAQQVVRDLNRSAADQLRYVESAVSHHQRGSLASELAELEQQTGVISQVLRDGAVVFASRRLEGTRLSSLVDVQNDARGQRYHVASSVVGPYAVAVAVPSAPSAQIRGRLRAIMLGSFLFALLASAFTARWLAARTAGPLERLTAAVERVEVQTLKEPIVREWSSYAEVERLAAAFEGMLTRLDAAVDRLKRFVADASHELKTPVAILKAHAQATLDTRSTAPDTVAYVRDGLVEIARLEALIEDLLIMSRLDAGWSDRERVDLSDFVIETVEQMQPLAQSRELSFVALVPEPVTVVGDRRQLRRLVTNLVDNALKYTPPGGRVEVNLARSGQQVLMRVSDTGAGIDPSSLPHIFEPFFREDSSRSRDTGGAGLGLAIASRVCGAHRGRLVVDSAPGRGSVFSAILPAGG